VRDPKVTASDADLEASVQLQLRIRDDISASADIVNQLEAMRKQLEDAQKALRAQKEKEDLAKSMTAMDKRMLDVENLILEPASMLSDDKYFVQAYRVYMNLIWLNGEVGPGAGDVAGGADFRPTDTSVAVLQTIEKDLDAAKAAYKKLMETELPAFNRTLAERGLTPVV
jgi:soluble cytochrome b562